MDRSTEMDLIRRLHGELPPERERELAGRLEREPELAQLYARLVSRWASLELPPPSPPPLGYTGRVMAHVRGAVSAGAGENAPLSWSLAPTWVRAAAAAALVAGMALGAGLSLLPARPPRPPEFPPGTAAMGERVPLADSYWSLFADETAPSPRGALPPLPPEAEARP